MSSSDFGFFKRPRSKSEKQVRPPRTVFGDFSSAYSSIAGHPPILPCAAPPDSVENTEASRITSPESQEPTSIVSTIPDSLSRRVGSDSPSLPVTRDLFQPGAPFPIGSQGYISLLQSSPPPVSPDLPAGPPPTGPSEIGTKFLTSSYGPGVDQRIFHDPNFRSTQSPPEDAVTATDRLAQRRSASMTNLTLLYHDNPSPLRLTRPAELAYYPSLPSDASPVTGDFARRRHFGAQNSQQSHVGFPTFFFPRSQTEEEKARVFSNDEGLEDRVEDLLPPNVFLESRAQNSQDYVEDNISGMTNLMGNEETSGNEAYGRFDAYEQVGEYDNDVNAPYENDEQIEHDASSLYNIQPIHPRYPSGTSSLGQYMWTPRGSLDAGSVFTADVEAQPYVHSSTTQGPAGPPSTPLPHLPSQFLQNINCRGYRDMSTTTEQFSHSSESYGNTRNLLGLPQPRIPSGQNSAQSFARFSITDLEGSIRSRSLSEIETHELEDDIRAHLEPIGETNMLEEHIHNRDRYKHSHRHAGSLSISYFRTESQAGETGPGSSQGSSSFGLEMHAPRDGLNRREAISGREGRLGFHDESHSQSRVRSGTPPLLFGRRALDSNDLDFSEPLSSGMRSNGRLAQVLAAAGSRSDSRLTAAVPADEDCDWETETGSGAFSRQFVREPMAQGETGSSYADNSDSGSLSQSKVTRPSPAEPIAQQSSHARYSQNWTLLQDKESGNMVLAPDPQALASAAATRSPYQHPSPLSKEHTHPFSSSPPSRKSTQVSPLSDKSSRFEANLVRSHQPSGREKVTNKNYYKESPLSCAIISGFGTGTMSDGRRDEVSSRGGDRKGRSHPSSAWLSTVDGDALSDHSNLSSGGGSFSKVTTLGAKANVTGTPEGSGARQVGSSLADASSPILANSPFVQHTPHKQNSAHDQISHRNQHSPLNQSSPPRFQLHLGEASNPRTASAAKTLQRRTFDSRLDPGELEASSAQLNQSLRKYPVGRDLLDNDNDDEELQLTRAKANLSPEIRRHRQDLVEHSLLPRLPENPATEPKRLSVPLELLTTGGSLTMANTPPNTVGMRVGGSMPQFILNSPDHEVRKRSPHRQASTGDLAVDVESDDDHLIRATAPSPLRWDKINRTRSDFDVLEPSTKDNVAAATETGQAQSQPDPSYPGGLPYDSMYGDFLQKMRGESTVRAVRPPMRQRQYNRPIARAESPHLHRVPLLTIEQTLARQKELSRAYLWRLIAVFPLLPLFGYGLLDGVIAWHTGGEVATFRHNEKVVALWVGYGSFAAILAGLCLLLAFLL
ncbi:hypothetical protein MMC29_000324 [Sticta canariensis]|nr:hypothetical protein [Sticta canariensis]